MKAVVRAGGRDRRAGKWGLFVFMRFIVFGFFIVVGCFFVMETGLLTLGLGCVAGFYRKKFHTARWLWLNNSELAEFVYKY
jgi:hypothetical protein